MLNWLADFFAGFYDMFGTHGRGGTSVVYLVFFTTIIGVFGGLIYRAILNAKPRAASDTDNWAKSPERPASGPQRSSIRQRRNRRFDRRNRGQGYSVRRGTRVED